jgi:hypothetical protein
MKRSITALELVKVIKDITEDNIQQVNRLVSKMSESQLNWNQNPGVWSVAQVLAHLNAYAAYYHPTLIKKIEGTRFTNAKEDFVSSPLGKSAWKSMKLGNAKNIKRKFKAPKGYNPYTDTSLVTGNEVTTFLEGQQELLSIAESAGQVNLKRIKIPISISKIVRLRLGDALLFITYHNERHMQQIINLKKHPNFPRK